MAFKGDLIVVRMGREDWQRTIKAVNWFYERPAMCEDGDEPDDFALIGDSIQDVLDSL